MKCNMKRSWLLTALLAAVFFLAAVIGCSPNAPTPETVTVRFDGTVDPAGPVRVVSVSNDTSSDWKAIQRRIALVSDLPMVVGEPGIGQVGVELLGGGRYAPIELQVERGDTTAVAFFRWQW